MPAKNEHTSAFKKLGLASIEYRYSSTWDHSYNTFANVFELAPEQKPLMKDLEKYISKQKYKHISTNQAMMYATNGKRSTFRCYFFRRAKFDFIIAMSRQTVGKKEYLTRVEFHYEQAPVRPPKGVPSVEVITKSKPKTEAKTKVKETPTKTKTKSTTRRRLTR